LSFGRFGLGRVFRIWVRAKYIRVWGFLKTLIICDEDEEPGGATMPPRELLVAVEA